MKIFDEKGVTLIELLATLTVLMIVLPVIYGVFSSGLKLYNKIQIEGQLRDDADYAVTMVMNTFYSYPFDEVTECGNNCIALINNKATTVKKEEKNFYTVKKDQVLTEQTSIKIQFPNNDENGDIEIDGKKLDVTSNFDHSTISYTCQNNQVSCEGGKDGMIHIDLQLNHDRLEKPFHLQSQFGF
ncbi:prepilin-type N-terminal cleavage/methylation domain-containing protein [Neobacillus sp. OS1-2]|uniref:PilW family protein n=1 Tax=Neobacillus sp. OS1-2 TaxID=3070680 RepID=UPI0027E169C1|nr:prepilin-type N-terminal cleavage/methylation domain-containing protein [Neobacillus sp. OS1-2]WML40727.1 prepilin-type N-terminal cleavage/methylation domain-containing protein [Neobacillus sp. OS1-2]